MQMFKKVAWVAVVLVWVGVLSGCSSLQKAALQKPTAKYLESKIVSLSLEGASLEVVLEVYNPNSYSINLGALDYELQIQGAKVTQGSQLAGSKLKAGKSSRVVLPLEVEFADLVKLVKGLSGMNSLDYAVTGGMTFVLPVIGGYRASYTAKGKIPKPVMPELSLAEIKKEELGITGAKFKVGLKVKNPNIFDLNLKELSYSIKLNNSSFTDGKLGEQKLAAGQETRIDLPVNLNFSPTNLGSLYRVLSKGSDLSYKLDFNSNVSSGLKALKPFVYKGDTAGRVSF